MFTLVIQSSLNSALPCPDTVLITHESDCTQMMTLCWFIAHCHLQHGGKSDQEDNVRPNAAGHGAVFYLKVQHNIFLAKGSKEQEPDPAPPAVHSKALHQEALQTYLIYLPGHNAEIGLQ